jgi:acetyl esterase/lipase
MTVPSILKSCVILLTSIASTACSIHHAGPSPPASPERTDTRYVLEREIRDFVYTQPGWPQPLRADLYLPQRSDRLPVVITIHGGGWANRSRNDMASISDTLVERGYAVLNLNYRFAPTYTFPAQLDDMYQALRWLRDNADRYHLDVTRINAWGYSSGAQLAALLGGFDRDTSTFSVRQLPRLRAVVAGGIPADLRKYDDSPIVERFLGGTPDNLPAIYALASPAAHISADDPPVFLYHGRLDFLVTLDQPQDYYDALVDAGVPSELYLQGLRGHATMFLFGGEAESRAVQFLDRYNSTAISHVAPVSLLD